MPVRSRAALAIRVWATYARVRALTWKRPLPAAVERIMAPPRRRPPTHSPERLRRAVERSLWPVGGQPRCLFTALTLMRLLQAQGDRAELVIGLPEASPDHRAHAWVEMDGVDVGPNGGRAGHEPIGRFP